MKTSRLVQYLNSTLKIEEFDDISNNGLQVEGADETEHVALAVDACQATVDAAIACGAQMLVVHHGLFWGRPLFLTGPHRKRVKALLDAGCSLYAAHLPLDAHPEMGNNSELARLLGLDITGRFSDVGVEAQAPPGLSLDQLVTQVETITGSDPRVFAWGPSAVRRVAIMSGRASREVEAAARSGCDTLVTGEPLHEMYHEASELGINVVFAGHYATERVGLAALARRLETELDLETTFIDVPTGL
jgi:dinuclear metal center YbgI/SA1388 family protein